MAEMPSCLPYWNFILLILKHLSYILNMERHFLKKQIDPGHSKKEYSTGTKLTEKAIWQIFLPGIYRGWKYSFCEGTTKV